MESGEMAAAIQNLRNDLTAAQGTALQALQKINTHEEVCALRYENISTKMDALPKIHARMDDMAKRVYTATGVWIAVVGFGIVVTLIGGIITILYMVLHHGGTV